MSTCSQTVVIAFFCPQAATYRDGKASGHSVQVVGVASHSHDLGNYLLARPLHPKDFRQLFQVMSGSLTNGEDGVPQPTHAQVAQFLIKELDTELAREQGNVLDDGKANSPLLVLGQLNDCWQQRLRQQVDADDCDTSISSIY